MKNVSILVLTMLFLQSCGTFGLLKVHKAEIIAATGATGIGGPKSSPSWKDPVGVQVGIETKILEINKSSSVSTGVNLTYQGAGYDSDEYTGRVRLSYLNIPFIYTYQSNGGFYGEIGLQPGLLLTAKDKGDSASGFSYNEDYKEDITGFDVGIPVGAGYQISKEISVGVRGIWGLINNNDYPDAYKDHNYMILGIVRFNIGSLGKE